MAFPLPLRPTLLVLECLRPPDILRATCASRALRDTFDRPEEWARRGDSKEAVVLAAVPSLQSARRKRNNLRLVRIACMREMGCFALLVCAPAAAAARIGSPTGFLVAAAASLVLWLRVVHCSYGVRSASWDVYDALGDVSLSGDWDGDAYCYRWSPHPWLCLGGRGASTRTSISLLFAWGGDGLLAGYEWAGCRPCGSSYAPSSISREEHASALLEITALLLPLACVWLVLPPWPPLALVAALAGEHLRKGVEMTLVGKPPALGPRLAYAAAFHGAALAAWPRNALVCGALAAVGVGLAHVTCRPIVLHSTVAERLSHKYSPEAPVGWVWGAVAAAWVLLGVAACGLWGVLVAAPPAGLFLTVRVVCERGHISPLLTAALAGALVGVSAPILTGCSLPEGFAAAIGTVGLMFGAVAKALGMWLPRYVD